MKWIFGFLLAAAVAMVLVSNVQAQDKKADTATDRASGIVTAFEKDTGTLSLRDRRNANLIRTVLLSPETKLQFDGKPATQDQIAIDRSVVCMGKFEGVKLRAQRCDIK